MSKQTTIRLPKVTNVQEAIDMDSSLVYQPLPRPLFEDIKADKVEEAEFEGMVLDKHIIAEIKNYSLSTSGTPQIITYKEQVIKAVSALFRPIPLRDIWDNTVGVLGEPISQKPISQGIVCQFPSVHTRYGRGKQETEKEYELKPTVLFSYNFAERSFQLGFCVGIMTCANQLFFFCSEFKTKIVHNVYHMKNFKIGESIHQFKDSWKTVENLIEASKTRPVEDYKVPVMYWKSSNGTATHIKNMFEKHFERNEAGTVVKENYPKTLWDVAMNTTFVSTHQIDNFNVGFETSYRTGNFMCKNHNFRPHDFVLSLGYYMRSMDNSNDETWNDVRPYLKPLKGHVTDIIAENYQAPQIEASKEPTKTEIRSAKAIGKQMVGQNMRERLEQEEKEGRNLNDYI